MSEKFMEDMLAKVAGYKDAEDYRVKRTEEVTNYMHLLASMSPNEFQKEICSRFSDDLHQACLLVMLSDMVFKLQNKQ